MSTTPTPRNSQTAKAPQLKGWVEIFKAGTHTDSKGREFKASTSDIDQIIANHSLGSAPAVLGHPKDNGPAYAWTEELRRDGDSLFAAFRDINPAFDDGVALGAYRNRSVRIVRDPTHGLRLRHVGWLGAEPPAIDGLMPVATDLSADEQGFEAFDFGAADDVLGSFIWAFDGLASMVRGMREWVIETNGVETADRVLPAYQIDSLVRASQEARDAMQRDKGLNFSKPTPTGDDMTITQQQLDDAVAAAKAAGKAEGVAEATNDFAAQGQELAELRKARRDEKIDTVVADLKRVGKLLPAEEADFRVHMEHLHDLGSFEFSAADGSKKSHDPVAFFHDFVNGKLAGVKLGKTVVKDSNDPGAVIDTNDPKAVAKAAHDFQAAEKQAGRDITYMAAVQQVINPIPQA